MRVQNVNNQPNFGIKYVNPKAWNPNVLKTFEKSNLLKEINSKYPNAEARYFHMKDMDMMLDSDDTYTTLFDIILNKEKIFRWNLSSHSKNVPDNHLVEALNKLTLKEVEDKSVQKLSPLAQISITVEKPNIFKRIYNKLLGK